jgi:hypothetical protein
MMIQSTDVSFAAEIKRAGSFAPGGTPVGQ